MTRLVRRPKRFLVWLFWIVVYLCRPRPRDFGAFMVRIERTWPPWWKFRPSVWHNDDGGLWEVYLTEESSYVEDRTFHLTCHIGQKTRRITGFIVYDEELEPRKDKGGLPR